MSHPLVVRPLAKQEAAALDRLVRDNGNARQLRRAQMIRLSNLGHKISEIAGLLNVSGPCVTQTIHRFNREGIAGLADKPRPGRPPRARDRYIRLLKEAVTTSPQDIGYVFSSWTLPRLREHLFRKTSVLLNPDYLSRLMARHGIVYRRPRHIMGHLRDPAEYDEKKAFLDFLKKTPSPVQPGSTSSSSTSVKFISTRP
jgi:transposase